MPTKIINLTNINTENKSLIVIAYLRRLQSFLTIRIEKEDRVLMRMIEGGIEGEFRINKGVKKSMMEDFGLSRWDYDAIIVNLVSSGAIESVPEDSEGRYPCYRIHRIIYEGSKRGEENEVHLKF